MDAPARVFSRVPLIDALVRNWRRAEPPRVYYLEGDVPLLQVLRRKLLARLSEVHAPMYLTADAARVVARPRVDFRVVRENMHVITLVSPVFAVGGYPEDARNPRTVIALAPHPCVLLAVPAVALSEELVADGNALRRVLETQVAVVLEAAFAEAARHGPLHLKLPALGMPAVHVERARQAVCAVVASYAADPRLRQITLEMPDFSPRGDYTPRRAERAPCMRCGPAAQRDLLDFEGVVGTPAAVVFGDPLTWPGGSGHGLEAAVADNTALRRFACGAYESALWDPANHHPVCVPRPLRFSAPSAWTMPATPSSLPSAPAAEP